MHDRRHLPLALIFGAWMACASGAGPSGALPADPDPERRPTTPEAAKPAGSETGLDARSLLQRPDFIRTASGEISVGVRCVTFCGHVHKAVNTWKMEPLNARGLARGRHMLEAALSKYPLELVSSHLDGVYLLRPGTLQRLQNGQWAAAAAGTYGTRTVFVGLDGTPRGEGWAPFSEAVFHHEFSSILVGKHPQLFDAKAWQAANPPDFTYVGKLGGSPQLTTNFLADGFVCTYGMVDVENDINTYAMWLFVRADWLLEQASRHPRVQKKVDLLIGFYGKLDPSFTRAFFREHGRTSLSAEDRREVEACGQAIAADPENGKPYGARACLYNNLELYPEALVDAETALRLQPQFGYGYYVRGWARVRGNMLDEALEDFTQAIAFGPPKAAYYQERARVYQLLGKAEEARQDRKTAKEMNAAQRNPDIGD